MNKIEDKSFLLAMGFEAKRRDIRNNEECFFVKDPVESSSIDNLKEKDTNEKPIT